MSKQNNLPDFLIDLADGIRTAEGTTDPINPQDFRSRVEALANSGGGGESGVPIKVATLPTPTAETVGKVYLNTTDGEYYVGKQSTDFILGEPVGDKIYFDTTKNPVDYVEYMNTCLIGMSNGTNTYYLSMKDILAAQGVTGYGHCYAMAVSTADMSSILGIAYIYCDVLSVAQFNSMIGASFGVSITQFGWQTNVLPISAVADYEVTTNNLADWDYLAYGEPRFDIENERDALIEDNVSKIVSSAKSIRPHAFYASKIAYANFSNATSIGTNAFTVSEIVKAYFPNVTYIGSDAFTNCLRLRNISLPKVEKIEARAFRACYNLKSITIGTITPPTIGAGDVNHPFTDCTALTAIYVPAESVEAYKAADGWSAYADKIQAIVE